MFITNTNTNNYRNKCINDCIAKNTLSFKNEEISQTKCVQNILMFMQLHFKCYENIFIVKLLQKLLDGSVWKTNWDYECGGCEPDAPMPWLDCLVIDASDSGSFIESNYNDAYANKKKIIDAKNYTPLDAVNIIAAKWDNLYNKNCCYYAMMYCLLASTNHRDITDILIDLSTNNI